MTSLMQLAMGLVFGLNLNKPPSKEPPHMMLDYDAQGCPRAFKVATRTIEERRAVIGCFSATAMYGFSSLSTFDQRPLLQLTVPRVSSYSQRIDALRWTPYLDECLQKLAESADHPNDILLVHVVRLQLILEKAVQIPVRNGYADAEDSGKPPFLFYMKALQSQLQDTKRDIPPDLLKNGSNFQVPKCKNNTLTNSPIEMLLMTIYNTELSIHEATLSRVPIVSTNPNFHRLESLYSCLQAAKSWIDIFLAFPPARYIGLSMLTSTQLAHCVVVTYRLSTLDAPDWDRGLVRETVNLSAILDQLGKNLAQVKIIAGLDHSILEDNDIFSGSSRKIRHIKAFWDAKVAADSTVPDGTTADEPMGEPPAEFLDDSLLEDLLGYWDYQFETYG
jgi:hypothetical protein